MIRKTIGNILFVLTFLYAATTSTVALSRDCDTISGSTSPTKSAFAPDCLWLGASGSFSESEYPGQSQANGFPEIHLESGPLYWINTTIGVVVASLNFANAHLGVAAQLSLPDSGFSSTNATPFIGLDERAPTLEGGLALFASGRYGQFELDMSMDLEGEHDGLRASMRYNYPIQLGAFSLAPAVSLSVQDASRSHYYYGVDRDDAAGSESSTYILDQPTAEFSLGWSLTHELGRRLMLIHNVEVRRVDEHISASPLTHRNTAYFSSIGVMYRFY